MLLYNSVGPNPRIVRMFAAERGVTLPMQDVDLRGGENRRDGYLAKNPAGQLPALELDDGTVLSEVTAICEYLDETAPGPSLIGADAHARAETRMWVRRIDLGILEPMANGFRYSQGLKMFESRIRCIPEAAEGLKAVAQDRLRWLDAQLAGREFVCGARLTLADLMLFCMLDFAAKVGQPIDPALGWVVAHHARLGARPSAAA